MPAPKLSAEAIHALDSHLEEYLLAPKENIPEIRRRAALAAKRTYDGTKKCPLTDGELLKYATNWFSNNARINVPKKIDLMKLQNWSLKRILARKEKEELAQAVSDAGVVEGQEGYLMKWNEICMQRIAALSEDEIVRLRALGQLWSNERPPADVRQEVAQKKSRVFCERFAKSIYKDIGVRLFFFAAYEAPGGKVHTEKYDFNDEIDNGFSFKKANPEWGKGSNIEKKWDTFAKDIFSDESEVTDSATKAREMDIQFELDDEGYPLFPPPSARPPGLFGKRRTTRLFIGDTYRKAFDKPAGRVPWANLNKEPQKFIAECYLPDEFKFQDPSRLNEGEIDRYIEHVVKRQGKGVPALRFKVNLDDLIPRAPKKRRQRKATKSTRATENRNSDTDDEVLENGSTDDELDSRPKKKAKADSSPHKSAGAKEGDSPAVSDDEEAESLQPKTSGKGKSKTAAKNSLKGRAGVKEMAESTGEGVEEHPTHPDVNTEDETEHVQPARKRKAVAEKTVKRTKPKGRAAVSAETQEPQEAEDGGSEERQSDADAGDVGPHSPLFISKVTPKDVGPSAQDRKNFLNSLFDNQDYRAAVECVMALDNGNVNGIPPSEFPNWSNWSWPSPTLPATYHATAYGQRLIDYLSSSPWQANGDANTVDAARAVRFLITAGLLARDLCRNQFTCPDGVPNPFPALEGTVHRFSDLDTVILPACKKLISDVVEAPPATRKRQPRVRHSPAPIVQQSKPESAKRAVAKPGGASKPKSKTDNSAKRASRRNK